MTSDIDDQTMASIVGALRDVLYVEVDRGIPLEDLFIAVMSLAAEMAVFRPTEAERDAFYRLGISMLKTIK